MPLAPDGLRTLKFVGMSLNRLSWSWITDVLDCSQYFFKNKKMLHFFYFTLLHTIGGHKFIKAEQTVTTLSIIGTSS